METSRRFTPPTAAEPVLIRRIEQIPKLEETHEVPETLHWDLWLGPVSVRPYNPVYLPGSWRGWLDFGTGCVGDWICHVVDPVFWALDLGTPTSVKAHVEGYSPAEHAQCYPAGTILQYEFADQGDRQPVTLFWYDGACEMPRPADLEPEQKIPTPARSSWVTRAAFDTAAMVRKCTDLPGIENERIPPARQDAAARSRPP